MNGDRVCWVCGKSGSEKVVDPASNRCRRWCFHRMKIGNYLGVARARRMNRA